MTELLGHVRRPNVIGKDQPFVRALPVLPERGNAQYMGEPDGPMRFVKSLGMEVPTYINPRVDLKTQYRSASAHISIDYHVPPAMRGPYLPLELADYDPNANYALTRTDKVRCGGLKSDGQICQKSAMNRTGFCTNHGGALHPADKMFSSERGIMPTDTSKLNRLQMVEMGIIPVNELTDEEIAKQQVMMNDGTFSKTTPALSAKIIMQMRAEFFERADRFVRENAMKLMEEMRRIAMSPVEEAKDKIQAITWLTERALGKTPDVLITNKTDAPFEQLMGDVVGGSRDAYRTQSGMQIIEGEINDGVIIIDDEHEEDESDNVVSITSVPASVPSVDDLAKQKRDIKNRIKANRNRKYAARAQGSDSLDNLAYEVEFKTVKLKTGDVTRMKIITPEAMKAPRTR